MGSTDCGAERQALIFQLAYKKPSFVEEQLLSVGSLQMRNIIDLIATVSYHIPHPVATPVRYTATLLLPVWESFLHQSCLYFRARVKNLLLRSGILEGAMVG